MNYDVNYIKEVLYHAGEYIMGQLRDDSIYSKGKDDYVTEIDLIVQDQIKTCLMDKYPDVQFMSEEQINEAMRLGELWATYAWKACSHGADETVKSQAGRAALEAYLRTIGEPESVNAELLEALRAFESSPKPGAFRLGDLVKKVSGSAWEGRIVGTYSTALTPEGYAVESASHPLI